MLVRVWLILVFALMPVSRLSGALGLLGDAQCAAAAASDRQCCLCCLCSADCACGDATPQPPARPIDDEAPLPDRRDNTRPDLTITSGHVVTVATHADDQPAHRAPTGPASRPQRTNETLASLCVWRT